MNRKFRDFQPGDEPAAAYVCLKTGDHGRDGEAMFASDPDALARIYVQPYLQFDPELALMLEDDQGICGYALGTLDSKQFFERYEHECRPTLCKRFAPPQGEASTWTPLDEVYHLYHHPDYYCPPPYEDYPAHLHIDLLPRAQGQGHGRRMIEELLRRMRAADSPGVHLGMSKLNEPAYGFYCRLGFTELARTVEAIYLGMRL